MQESIARPLPAGIKIEYCLRHTKQQGKGKVKQAGYYVIVLINDDGKEQIVFYDEVTSIESGVTNEQH